MAAQLAQAFLADTWRVAESLAWAHPVLASAGNLPEGVPWHRATEVWPQGEGDLGARVERVMRRGLRRFAYAIAIGADTPGLPVRFLELSRATLEVGAPAVIGPSDDGGFYLLGLRHCPSGLLAGIPWSSRTTFARTWQRLREQGLDPVVLPRWFDVDRPADLARLRALIAAGKVTALETERRLATLRLPKRGR